MRKLVWAFDHLHSTAVAVAAVKLYTFISTIGSLFAGNTVAKILPFDWTLNAVRFFGFVRAFHKIKGVILIIHVVRPNARRSVLFHVSITTACSNLPSHPDVKDKRSYGGQSVGMNLARRRGDLEQIRRLAGTYRPVVVKAIKAL